MPYFIGGHPGFNCPLLDDGVYEDYYLESEKEETCSVPRPFPETGMLDFQDRSPWLEGQKEIEEGEHLEDKKNVCLLEANQVEELGFEIEVL
ncbi:galactose mutarotase-like enzyme [Streptococcus pneumoniae]|nr:galactose mutarotase-like enzyme [Streptococcus pneumoniae]